MSGVFLVFEGTEGSGKSTQIRLLADRVRARGRAVCLLREPGGTPIGEEIRHTLQHSLQSEAMTPEAELLLLNGSRAQLVREVIRPALQAGQVVICDRFYHSTLAYQGYGRGLDLATVRQVIGLAVGPTQPDRVLLLRVPVAVSEARRQQRERSEPGVTGPDRMERAGREFFERVESGFDELARQEPDRIRVVDASQPVEAVAAAVWEAVRVLFDPPT